jgi:hypothetical protein
MEEQSSNESPGKAKNKWADRLRGRARMAVACIGGIVVVGMMGVTNPLLERIATAQVRLKKAETRATLAADVASLRHQAELYKKKLPRTIDLNDWTEYLLTGIRGEPVKLVRMDPKEQVSVGQCKVLTWQIDLEGDYQSLARVLSWMENGQRLVRVDRFVMQLPNGRLIMSLVVRGLALDKPESGKKDKAEGVKGAVVKAAPGKPQSQKGGDSK